MTGGSPSASERAEHGAVAAHSLLALRAEPSPFQVPQILRLRHLCEPSAEAGPGTFYEGIESYPHG